MNYIDNYAFANPYMVGDEYTLWKGKPEEGNLMMRGEIAVILFSIVWTSFAVFWKVTHGGRGS